MFDPKLTSLSCSCPPVTCKGVSDAGVGFDPTQADGGFGRTGMRERAALLGGRVVIDSAPGRGTVVEAELPLGSALDQVVVEREAD